MSSSAGKRGCHPVSFRSFAEEATSAAGSPARRGPSEAQPVHAVRPVQRPLAEQLALAIGRCRLEPLFLVDRHALGEAEQGGRRGEHELPAPRLDRRIGHRGHAAEVLAEIAHRPLHAVADQRERREVQHRVEGAEREGRLQRPAIIAAPDHQPRGRRDRPAVALGEVVEHHDLVPAVEQRQHGVAAHIAGSAGHEVTTQAGYSLKYPL